MRQALAVIVVLILTGCGSAATQRGLTDPVRPALRLTVIGDSISAGYYASSSDLAFPALVVRQMRVSGEQVAPTVISRAGATTTDAEHWDTGVGSDIVIVELGTNDWGNAVPVDQFTSRYDDLLTRIRVGSPRARLVCLGNWADKAELNGLGLTSQRYDLVVAQECASHGGGYVDLVEAYDTGKNHGPAGRPSFLGSADWFHPNDAGHAAIAGVVLARVLGATTSQASSPTASGSTGGRDAVSVARGGGR